MRNLKRALSLALASVMLLGMMVVGSSAAFTDADEIVNTEAVEITAGLGLFAGKEGGKFDPKGTVTRAEMATVIVKMLYGSQINADQFKGTGKFSDVSGWAEGYINLCSNLGIVSGYGDGTFQPEKKLNTAEAVTMIINALGVDAGKGDWPMTVMAAAEEIELFDGIVGAKPSTYAELSRDQLAVAVWNGLDYSPEGVKGYTVDGKNFATWSDALAYVSGDDTTIQVPIYDELDADGDSDVTEIIGFASVIDRGALTVNQINEDKPDSLKEKVFNVDTRTGYITENQATGEKYTMVNGEEFNIETGLDMLGHFVTVYYNSNDPWQGEKNPGTVYCIVDQAEYITVAETITNDKKEYKAAFDGTKYDAVASPVIFDEAGYASYESDYTSTAFTYVKGNTAAAGTYVIDNRADSDDAGKIIAYIAPIAADVAEVTTITTTAGKEAIRLSAPYGKLNNNEDDDVVVEYDGIAEDDVVIVKEYRDTITYLLKPEVVTGKITKTGFVDGDAAVYVDGTAYLNGGIMTSASAVLDVVSGSLSADRTTTYDVYLYNGKVVGANVASSSANLSEVIFVTDTYTTYPSGNYGSSSAHYYAQGVDAEGKEVSVLIGIDGVFEKDSTGAPNTGSSTYKAVVTADDANAGTAGTFETDTTNFGVNEFYTFEKSTDREQAKKDVRTATKADTYANYTVNVDEFYAEQITVPAGGLTLDQDTKYVGTGTAAARVTADTQFIVVERNTSVDKLTTATYTGKINKTLASNDVLVYAAAENADKNNVAKMVVIFTGSAALNVTDFIYVSDFAASDISLVDGGAEVYAYFSETDKFDYIVINDGSVTAGYYTNWEIDEEGVYDLDTVVTPDNSQFFGDELVAAIFDGELGTTNVPDLDANNAVIYDVRDPEDIKNADVAEITSLKEIQSAMKSGFRVYVEVKVDTDAHPDAVTHIFVYSVQYEIDLCDGTTAWVEDDGTEYADPVCVEADTNSDDICDECGEEI